MANPVTEVLEYLNHQVAQLSMVELSTIRTVMETAQKELTHDLKTWSALGKGDDRFTPQLYRNALLQIQSTLSHIDSDFKESIEDSLKHGGAVAGQLATKHLAHEVTTFSGMFEHSVRPIAFDAANVLAQGKKTLWPGFKNSAKRYAGQVGQDIKKQLAVGIVRGETIDQMTNRLAKLGGPKGWVYTRGQAGSPGAKAEYIAEGLFTRYRHFAERLAVTETVNAYNATALIGMDELEAEDPGYFRRWDAAIDKRTCDYCARYDDLVVPLNEKFPGGIDHPPLHPRCRCAVVVWRKEWDEHKVKHKLTDDIVGEGKKPVGVAAIPHRVTVQDEKKLTPEIVKQVEAKKLTPKIQPKPLQMEMSMSDSGAHTYLADTGYLDRSGRMMGAKGWLRLTDDGKWHADSSTTRDGKLFGAIQAGNRGSFNTKAEAEEHIRKKLEASHKYLVNLKEARKAPEGFTYKVEKTKVPVTHHAQSVAITDTGWKLPENSTDPKPTKWLKGPTDTHMSIKDNQDGTYTVRGSVSKHAIKFKTLEDAERHARGMINAAEVKKADRKAKKVEEPKTAVVKAPVKEKAEKTEKPEAPKPAPAPEPIKAKTLTPIAHEEILPWYDRLVEKYSAAEKKAYDDYQQSAYRNMNGHLRGTVKLKGEVKTEVQQYIKDLQAGVKKSRADRDMLVYRGSKHDLLPNAKPGDIFLDKGFISTSVDPKETRSFSGRGGTYFEIEVPKGQHISPMMVPNKTLVDGEGELLLPHGTKMEVIHTSMEDGVRVVRVRIINDEKE